MDTIKRLIGKNDILRVLSLKPFSFLMLSELFSQFAFNLQNFALIFIIYSLTHSNSAVSGIILSFTIPAILLSIISGVYVDRWQKKNVMFNINLLRSFLLLPLLIPNLPLGFIYLLTFSIAVATQFFIPAEASIIPMLVPTNLILSANSVFTLGIYGTILGGYILAGPTLLLIGKTGTIILLSLLFLLSALFILLIKIPAKKKSEMEKAIVINKTKFSFAEEMRELFSFIRKTKKVMRALTIVTIAQALIFVFAVLGPGYLATILNVKIESLSFILIAPAALGIGIGALILGTFCKKSQLKHLSSLGFLLVGIIFTIFPFLNKVTSRAFIQSINAVLPHLLAINILHIVVLLAVVIGFAFSFVYIPSNATIQLETNERIRGRIYGFLNALIGAISFLPVIAAGGLADLFGVGIVIISIGITLFILSILFFIFE